MASTTPTDMQINRHAFVLKEKLIALAVLLVSAAVLSLALPRVRAALNHLAVGSAIDSINKKETIDSDKLDELIETAKTSLSLQDDPHYWHDLSTLQMYQWQNSPDLQKSDKKKLLTVAKRTIEQSLAGSPANAFQWFRLAVIDFILGSSKEQSAKALLMSIMTGPNEAGILLSRINLGLMLTPFLSADETDLLAEQIATAWSWSPVEFVNTVVTDPIQMDKIRLLLEDNYASVLQEMEETYETPH